MIAFTAPPPVRAHVRERLVFNFRLDPAALARRLPRWLRAQTLRGSSVGSFCVLDLDRVRAGIVPAPRALHAAHRFGVLDASGPAVYVTERVTSSRVGSLVTSCGFPCRHPHATFTVEERDGARHLRVVRGERVVFAATFAPAKESTSSLFPSAGDLQRFLAAGVASYAPSIEEGTWSKVDLAKIEGSYAPLRVLAIEDAFLQQECGATFDGAFATRDGVYTWRLDRLVRDEG